MKDQEAELYKQRFDNVASKYENALGVTDFRKSMLEEKINQSEAKGYITSTKYYSALKTQEQSNINKLEAEKKALLSQLNAAVKSGAIKKYSEDWYDICNTINDVTLAEEEAKTKLIEYQNEIRETKWEIEDLIHERISQITDESDFLIDLMSSDELYTDKGQLTDEGMATMGLHGVNYNVDMAQAQKYAKNIATLNKEIAKDPYNQTLLTRRQELLEAQRESILAAQDEKEAIRDMVEDGIERELDSLSELIDKYSDALDAQKDLYDYSKNIKSSTKEIASLQKQLSSYENDLSEESKAKIQQLKVSLEDAQQELEETEYDKYISDQKELMDNLYDEYEDILNKRLDDLSLLIQDMATMINDNASGIGETLAEKTEGVGTTLSEAMNNIWSNDAYPVMSTNDANMSAQLTTINDSIGKVDADIAAMVTALNKEATTEVKSVVTSSATSTKAASGTAGSSGTQKKTTTSSSSKTSSSSSSSKWGSWFVKKKYTGNKSKLNKNTSIVDRLAYFDFANSFTQRAKYYKAMGKTDAYKGTATQNTWMLKQMKAHSFQHGGTIGDLINKSGEDGFVLARTGEEVLSLDKIKALGVVFDKIEPITDVLSNLPEVTPISESFRNSSNIDNLNIEFSLPGVENYEDFKYKMQHDSQFEKMVRAMTVDRMFGGSSLKKYNC